MVPSPSESGSALGPDGRPTGSTIGGIAGRAQLKAAWARLPRYLDPRTACSLIRAAIAVFPASTLFLLVLGVGGGDLFDALDDILPFSFAVGALLAVAGWAYERRAAASGVATKLQEQRESEERVGKLAQTLLGLRGEETQAGEQAPRAAGGASSMSNRTPAGWSERGRRNGNGHASCVTRCWRCTGGRGPSVTQTTSGSSCYESQSNSSEPRKGCCSAGRIGITTVGCGPDRASGLRGRSAGQRCRAALRGARARAERDRS